MNTRNRFTALLSMPAAILASVLMTVHQGALAEIDAEALRAAHQRVIEQPGDLDRLYAYAQLAIDQRNYEAAAGALESMLVISSRQPRVWLELGTLYQRMGAPRVAAAYLKRARELAEEGSDIARFADQYLYETDKATDPNSLSGFVMFGLRYQTNPTLAPETSEILSGGFRVPLPEDRDEQGDVNGLLLSRLEHRYRFDDQRSIDSDAIFYGTLYNDHSRLNLGALQLTTGFRFSDGIGTHGEFSVRPHVVARGSMRDGDVFEKTIGLGLDGTLDVDERTRFKALYQYRDVNYENIGDTRTAELRSGGEHRIDLRGIRELAPGHVLMLRLFGRIRDAETDFFETDQYDITLRYSSWFDNFMFDDQRKMSASPYVVRRFTDYGGEDPGIDPDTTREDREWRLGLDWSVPFHRDWNAVLNLEYSKVNSNVVNYDSTNKLIMFGLRRRF